MEGKTIKLYSIKSEIIMYFSMAALLWFIFQSLWLGLLVSGFLSWLYAMSYHAKVFLKEDEFCVWFYLRPFYPPRRYRYEEIEKVLFHEQMAAGSSDVIEIILKSGKKHKHHLYFSNKDLDEILVEIEGKANFVLPKSRQPDKYR